MVKGMDVSFSGILSYIEGAAKELMTKVNDPEAWFVYIHTWCPRPIPAWLRWLSLPFIWPALPPRPNCPIG